VTQAEERQFAIQLLQTVADFLCSPSLTERYAEKAFFSRGMHTRVERRYEVLHAIEVLQSDESQDKTVQELLAELLPSFGEN